MVFAASRKAQGLCSECLWMQTGTSPEKQLSADTAPPFSCQQLHRQRRSCWDFESSLSSPVPTTTGAAGLTPALILQGFIFCACLQGLHQLSSELENVPEPGKPWKFSCYLCWFVRTHPARELRWTALVWNLTLLIQRLNPVVSL